MQKWWLLGVGVLGIAFAVLLIPRPDTGSDLAPLPPAPKPASAEEDQTPDAEEAPAQPRRGRPSPDQMRPGPPPGVEKVLAERDNPESLMAKEMAAPWGGVRFMLTREGSEEAKALAAKISPHQSAFAQHIRNPDGTLDEDIAAAETMVAELEASPWASDPTVVGAIARYRAAVEKWNATEKPQE